MRKISVRELHIHTSEFVREAQEGSVIIIERRGEPVAELRPIGDTQPLAEDVKARIFDSMGDFRKRMPQTGDSSRFIEEDRDR